MRKYIFAIAFVAATGLQAQNVYEIERASSLDLNGTARSVGMGGAMNALGADLSTMSGNPGAIGLYRRSDFALTASVQTQKGAQSFGQQSRTRGSFDQAGMVYSFQTGGDKVRFVNFGFNYQKTRNLKQFIGTDGWVSLFNPETGDSPSQLWRLGDQLAGAAVGFPIVGDDVDFPDYNSPVSNGAYDAGLLEIVDDGNGYGKKVLSPASSEAYRYSRANWGHVNTYDINMAFNIKDRAYFGVTAGIYEVSMGSRLYYEEILQAGAGNQKEYSYGLSEDSRMHGTGFDMKFGLVVRPIEENPFRFGIAFHTPRVLSLTQSKWCQFDTQTPIYTEKAVCDEIATGSYDYNIRTPWRLQLSAATTVSDWLALDAEYELANCSKTAVKYPDHYTYDGPSLIDSELDRFVDNEVDYCLRPQHTVRLGAEARFAGNFYGRIGYNFVSSPFKKEAFLNLPPAESTGDYSEVTNSTYNATSTDYINLGNTNRLSLGLGWHGKNVYFDAAYILQNQSADAYMFDDVDLKPFAMDIVRHSALFTFGVKF